MSAEFEARPVRVDGGAAEFEARAPEGLAYFDGHFDGAPVLPAVAQLEALVLPLCRAAWGDLGAPRRWLRLKFRRPIGPGGALTVRLTRGAGGGVVEFAIACAGEAASTGAADFGGAAP